MKRITKYTTLLFAVVSIFLFSNCSNSVDSENQSGLNTNNNSMLKSEEILASINQLPVQELSTEEKQGIILMREEEKLARDVYQVLYSVWNSKVFNNISLSEQRHTDAVKRIIEKYQLTDPVADDANGVFTNNTLKTLYAQLTEAGKTSLVDGLKVGAAIEEIDILDLQHQLNEVVDNQDIQLVYKNLMLGSYNHLKSFVKNLSVQGIAYSPQYLDEETYNSIINN